MDDRTMDDDIFASDVPDGMEAFVRMKRPPPPAPPTLQAVGADSIRVSWVVPPGEAAFRSVSVLMRPADVGDVEWYRVDSRTKYLVLECWKDFPAEPAEVEVSGLSRGMPYEAMLIVQTVRGFSLDSPVSEPIHLSAPGAPAAPVLEAVGGDSIRIRWTVPPGQVQMVLLFVRQSGDAEWGLVDQRTGTLLPAGFAGGQACQASPSEIVVSGLNAERPYEAKLAALNTLGWSEPSPISAALQLSHQ